MVQANNYNTEVQDMISVALKSLTKVGINTYMSDMNTTYSILYTNPSVYTAELYPKKAELLEGYSALGTVVLNKTPEEINHFITTGSFPTANQNAQQPVQPEAVVPNPGYSQPPVNNFVSQAPFQPTMPVDDPFAGQSVPQRPIRYYD